MIHTNTTHALLFIHTRILINTFYKILLLTFSLLLSPTSLSAAAADSCPGDLITSTSVNGHLKLGLLLSNQDDYYRYNPGAGSLTISYNSDKRINFEVGSICGDHDILRVNNQTSGSATITLAATDIIYIHAQYKNNATDYTISLDFTPSPMSVVDNADDLCYETPSSGGLLCIDGLLGIVDVGLLCKESINIRNQSTEDLSDVQAVYGFTDLLNVNALSDCGIDNVSGSGGLLGGALDGLLNETLNGLAGGLVGSLLGGLGGIISGISGVDLNTPVSNLLNILTSNTQTCGLDSLVDAGPLAGVGLFQSQEWFNLPDYGVDDVHSIYHVPLLNAALFSHDYDNLYGYYIKDGVRHRGQIPPCSADLTITKTDSIDPVEINSPFSYIITVTNNKEVPATNIVVTDTLPAGVTFLNTAGSAPAWSCTESSGTLTCTYSGTITSAASSDILVNVTAPPSAGTITNEANVTSDHETDLSNNTATEETLITAPPASPTDLCYLNVEGTGNRCELAGEFYYAPDNPHNCDAQEDIRNQNLIDNLQNVVVTKLYQETATNGSCSSDQGSCSGPSAQAIDGFTSYQGGYTYTLGTLNADTNTTIYDSDTYDSGDNISDIILYGAYYKNGVLHAGQLSECNSTGGTINIYNTLADVVDDYTYDGTTYTPWIKTKITQHSSYQFKGVYLGSSGIPQVYNPTSDKASFTILIRMVDMNALDTANGETCQTASALLLTEQIGSTNPVVVHIPAGEISALSNAFTMAYSPDRTTALVKKNIRLKFKAIDIDGLIDYYGVHCAQRSSTTGNVKGIPQCLIANPNLSKPPLQQAQAIQNYITIFGLNAFTRCYTQNGEPCWASHGGIGAAPYDHEYGCFECSLGEFPYSCSSDNFAIRPDHFNANIAENQVFVSGENTPLTFTALDGVVGNPLQSYNYNEVENNSFIVDVNLTDATKSCPTTVELNGTVAFVDGIDSDIFKFNDIGKDINFTIHEINGSEYAFVDADDTPDILRYITPFERNISVIPDHFSMDANLTDHNSDQNFTYLHDINRYDADDNYAMAAGLTVTMQARGADNNITRNYMETCYAQDTNLTIGLLSTVITYPSDTAPLSLFVYYNPREDNGTIDSGEFNTSLPAAVGKSITIPSLTIQNSALSFPSDAPDGNGTTVIQYKLNFDRKENLVVNPFKLTLSDINITDSDDVNGTTGTLPNQDATYHYARSRASKFFYEDITESSVITPLLVDVYCDRPASSYCSLYNIDTITGITEDDEWYISTKHTLNDGRVAVMAGAPLIEGSGSPTINGLSNPNPLRNTTWSEGEDTNVTVSTNGGTIPMTVPIEIVRQSFSGTTYTNAWLIYNPDDPIPLSPFYKVRFIGGSTWTGEGDTGYVVDLNASYKKHKKMDW